MKCHPMILAADASPGEENNLQNRRGKGESKTVSKEDLREMQDYPQKRESYGYL